MIRCRASFLIKSAPLARMVLIGRFKYLFMISVFGFRIFNVKERLEELTDEKNYDEIIGDCGGGFFDGHR